MNTEDFEKFMNSFEFINTESGESVNLGDVEFVEIKYSDKDDEMAPTTAEIIQEKIKELIEQLNTAIKKMNTHKYALLFEFKAIDFFYSGLYDAYYTKNFSKFEAYYMMYKKYYMLDCSDCTKIKKEEQLSLLKELDACLVNNRDELRLLNIKINACKELIKHLEEYKETNNYENDDIYYIIKRTAGLAGFLD